MKRYDFPIKDGQKLGYTVFVPDNFNKEDKLPMITSLHGAGERGNGKEELDVCTNIGIGKYIKNGLMDINAIVLCPQCPKENVWSKLCPEVLELIEKVSEEYNADSKRLSLTGMSMGGFGTWEMGMSYPSYFSALAPICGGGMAWRTNYLKNKPIWAFHGDCDPIVDINNSYEMVNKSRANGARVKFTIFNGVEHNSWDNAYLDTKVIDWLLNQKLL